jgi:TolA-binding protein
VRFPDSEAAALAAFHLGQVVFDQGGAPADARRAFAAYLAERPHGQLAQEALGRLLEIERLLDGRAAADLATQYLRRFPEGPHATLARSLAVP